MTIAGWLLVSIVSRGFASSSTLASTQVILPPTVDCQAVVVELEDRRNGTSAYCIPLYAK